MKTILKLIMVCIFSVFTLYCTAGETGPEKVSINYRSEEISPSSLLFGQWRVLRPYLVRLIAFDINRYESFLEYESFLDDPFIIEFIEPYNAIFIDMVIEFYEDSYIQDGNIIVNSPNYEFTKVEGHIYGDATFMPYRPFNDYFKDFYICSYYRFYINNFFVNNGLENILGFSGFIVSDDYILCATHDDWVFYILERIS